MNSLMNMLGSASKRNRRRSIESSNSNQHVEGGTTTVQKLWKTVDRELRENIGASVRCGICLSTVQDAVMTPCVHSFCSGCIDLVLSQQQRDAKCPECQQGITKRSCQPYEMMNEMAAIYKETLKDFGLCPSISDPTFTTLTQAVHDDSSDEEDDNDNPTKHMERSQVSKAWQRSFKQDGGSVKPVFVSENAQVVESNERSLKGLGYRKRSPSGPSERSTVTTKSLATASPHSLTTPIASKLTERPPPGPSAVRQAILPVANGTIHSSTQSPGPAAFPSTQEIIDQAQEQQAADRSAEWLEEEEEVDEDDNPSGNSSINLFQDARDRPPSPTPTFGTAREEESQESENPKDDQEPRTIPARSESVGAESATSHQELSQQQSSPTEEMVPNNLDQSRKAIKQFSLDEKSESSKQFTLGRNQKQDNVCDEEGGNANTTRYSQRVSDDDSEATVPILSPRSDTTPRTRNLLATSQQVGSAHIAIEGQADRQTTSEPALALEVGSIVEVQPRTWVGINKPGGVARITNVHADGSCDVAYILGGKECGVDAVFVKQQSEGNRQRRRKPPSNASSEAVASSWRNELPPDLIAALANEGFDTGVRPKKKRKKESSDPVRCRSLDSKRGVRKNTDPGRHSAPARKTRRGPFQNASNIASSRSNDSQNNQKKPKHVAQGKRSAKTNANAPSRQAAARLPQNKNEESEERPKKSAEVICRLADARYLKVVEAAIDDGILHIVASNLTERDMDVLRGFCRKTQRAPVKMKLAENFGNKIKLCIAHAAPNGDNRDILSARSRTLKSMRAALAGIPIVSPEYIYACQEADTILVPQPSMSIRSLPSKGTRLESSGASSYGVATLAADIHESVDNLLLSRKAVLLCGAIAPAKRRDIQLLLKESGAEILPNPTAATTKLKQLARENAKAQTVVLLCEDTNCNSSINVIPTGLGKQAKLTIEDNPGILSVVNTNWLFDSISWGSALDATDFKPVSLEAQELWSLLVEKSARSM